MATQVESDADGGVATLVGGIVHDARRLLAEQLALFQTEIRNDVTRTLKSFIPIIAGVLVLAPGILLLAMGAAYGLCWAFPTLPTWAGFAIVGGTIIIVGGILLFVGASMLKSSKLVPETALQELKENIAVLGERKE